MNRLAAMPAGVAPLLEEDHVDDLRLRVGPRGIQSGDEIQDEDPLTVDLGLVVLVERADPEQGILAEGVAAEAPSEVAVEGGLPKTPSMVLVTRMSLAGTVKAFRTRRPTASTSSAWSA